MAIKTVECRQAEYVQVFIVANTIALLLHVQPHVTETTCMLNDALFVQAVLLALSRIP